ncbi:MAG: Rrf2 family transcriptional regulator [Clostridia bacterium]|nr:Rrf2 family transcriptional regulator [Clostridia bacterium]
MKISTKGRYALRMFIYLAENRENGDISLKEISEDHDISKKYLEQIIALFSKTNMPSANRGPQGGYKLTKAPEEYSVGGILRVTEGDLSPVMCAGESRSDCLRSADCAALPVWQGLSRVINEYLDGISLQDIADARSAQNGNDYII